MAFRLKIIVNAPHEPSGKLQSILPFQLDLSLNLADIPQQILQLSRLRREQR